MSCCFAPESAGVQAQAADPGLHVNYVRGLVLDVDDFTQEFAYHDGRDRWLVRDALGFGTLRGLRVTVADSLGLPDDPDKWKVTVAAGTAADPCGRLVCVPRDQCGGVNAWLAGHGDAVAAKLGAGTQLDLHVVLSYADCLTASVPVPGEPCRSEDTLKSPSRVADDFVLDFALDAPLHTESAGQREFAQWLRSIPTAGGDSSHDRAAFAGLVEAWKPGDTEPPAGLEVAPADRADYLRDALRIWATVLRPLVYGRDCGCGVAGTPPPCDPRVLLATLRFEVERPQGKPMRAKALPAIDETLRPVITPARLLAECLVRGDMSAAAVRAPALAPAAPVLRPVAAGKLAGDGSADGPVFGGLRVVDVGAGTITFGFDGYELPAGQHQYIVKSLAVSTAADPSPVLRFLEYTADGFVLRVNPGAKAGSAKAAVKEHAFVLQVDEIRA